jgi:hypothetical protein
VGSFFIAVPQDKVPLLALILVVFLYCWEEEEGRHLLKVEGVAVRTAHLRVPDSSLVPEVADHPL